MSDSGSRCISQRNFSLVVLLVQMTSKTARFSFSLRTGISFGRYSRVSTCTERMSLRSLTMASSCPRMYLKLQSTRKSMKGGIWLGLSRSSCTRASSSEGVAKSCFSIAGSSLYVLCFIDDRFKNGHLQKYTNKGDMAGRNVNIFILPGRQTADSQQDADNPRRKWDRGLCVWCCVTRS